MSGYVKDHKTIIGFFFVLLAIGGLLYLVSRKSGSGGSGGSGVTTTRKDYGKGGKKHVNPPIPGPSPIPGPAPVQSDCFVSKGYEYHCNGLDPVNDPLQNIIRCLPYKPELLDTMCDALDLTDSKCGQEYTKFFNEKCTGHTHINNNTNTSCGDLNNIDCGILNSAYLNNGMVNGVNVQKCYDDVTRAFYAPYIRNSESVKMTDCVNAELTGIPACENVQNASCAHTKPVKH